MKSLLVIVLLLISVNAQAYTFDGDMDPKEVFTYRFNLAPEQISPDMFIVCLKDIDKKPDCIVACIMMKQELVLVIAYAYYDDGLNFHHFILRGDHYTEEMPDVKTRDMLERKLSKMEGITGV